MSERLALSLGRRWIRPETEELEERTLLSGFTATTDGIHIWMDQLGNLSPQMTQFLATHVDGTQKQTPSQIAALQAINPNFGLLNYRLGTMSGPPMYIINGQWSSDFSMVTAHEDWFAHMTYGGELQSAADLASGRIRDTGDNSYAMDISNVTWQNYWLNSELQNLQATGANGTFVDSFTYGIGGAGYDSPPLRYQGTNAANPASWPGGVTWTDQLRNWAQTIENTFTQYGYKFIPNLDARVTSWEPNWYYNSNGVPFIDGAFLEGFGEWTDTYDWRLSMNRGLDLTRNGKIVIMQPYTSGSQQQIDFLVGTYLLLKGDHTYLAINGTSYYPEYQIDIGAPITAIPSAATGVDGYLWNGVYRRDFQNGFVLVNPGTTTYTLNLGGTYRQVQASGGGALSDAQLDANGNYIGGSLSYQNVGSITLVGASAAIFLNPTTTNAPPTVTANPTSQTVTAGQLVSFLAAATGTPAPTVQWQVSTNGGSTFSNIAGATSTTYSFTASTGQNGYQYRAVFTNTAGTATTSAATLTVNAVAIAPTVTSNPTNQTVTAGQSVSFTAAATGTPACTVQWQVSSNGGSTFTNIAGATSTTLTFATAAAQNGYLYRGVFNNSAGSATTSAAVLTVNFAPAMTKNPTNQTVTAGQSVSFSAAASGSPPPTVQWQVSSNGGATFTDIAGATSTTYTFTSTTSQSGHQYRAVFSNSLGSATSSAATLTVNAAATLPSGWHDVDIGSPGQRGSASATNGVFTVKGGGADIWNTSDQFNYAYRTLKGDGTVVARVTSQQNTDAWAKAGVMMRASTAANSTYAFAFLTPGNGAAFQYRTSAGAASGWTGQIAAAAPEWVKLVRSGSTVTGYASTDGINWTQLGSITISVGATVDVGLAVTAHNNSALSTATFDNVRVTLATAIVLHISEDAWMGNAQYTIAVDGVQVGGVRTAMALHSQGQSQTIVLSGPYSIGPHTVSITFLNDAYGGTPTTDRNLYVDGIEFNGIWYAGAVLYSNGTLTFQIG
jgi:hypothetical protein